MRIQETPAKGAAEWRRSYLQSLLRPIDGMWESIALECDHYLIERDEQTLGYCVLNSNRQLLQFYAEEPEVRRHAFEFALQDLGISEALIGTNDVATSCLCLDYQSSASVHTLLYRLGSCERKRQAVLPPEADFQRAVEDDLAESVQFCAVTLRQPTEWLEPYLQRLISHQQLFLLRRDANIIATGEFRPSESQTSYVDLGMIVHPSFRGQGIATAILEDFIQRAIDQNLAPICSTEVTNHAARKAIEKSGFVPDHRMVQYKFER